MADKTNWEKIKRVTVWGSSSRRVFSGKNCMMVLNEIQPDTGPELHHHPHEQLTYIIEGTCNFMLGDETMKLGKGDVLLVPPDVPHSLKVTGSIPVINLDVFSPIREEYLV